METVALIKAEIERLLKPLEHPYQVSEIADGARQTLYWLRNFIESLEQEQPQELDEAAEESATKEGLLDGPVHNAAVRTFKAGAKWMAEQGVSMEITPEVDWTDIDKFVYKHSGDNVIIQMRKK